MADILESARFAMRWMMSFFAIPEEPLYDEGPFGSDYEDYEDRTEEGNDRWVDDFFDDETVEEDRTNGEDRADEGPQGGEGTSKESAIIAWLNETSI